MTDAEILARIQQLVSDEVRLRKDGIDSSEEAEYDDAEARLDQCWDLLRRRRSSREAGGNPDDEQPRNEKTVERYQQ